MLDRECSKQSIYNSRVSFSNNYYREVTPGKKIKNCKLFIVIVVAQPRFLWIVSSSPKKGTKTMILAILKTSEKKRIFLLITLVPFPHFRASYPKVLFLSFFLSLAIVKFKFLEHLQRFIEAYLQLLSLKVSIHGSPSTTNTALEPRYKHVSLWGQVNKHLYFKRRSHIT